MTQKEYTSWSKEIENISKDMVKASGYNIKRGDDLSDTFIVHVKIVFNNGDVKKLSNRAKESIGSLWYLGDSIECEDGVVHFSYLNEYGQHINVSAPISSIAYIEHTSYPIEKGGAE
ncbi:MAG: hypothetical protein KBT28_10800 [Bacteroidales bacterium]|nr:hypothetical protein [Candidatus Colimorpha merdihippi]